MVEPLNVTKTLTGKRILFVGVTGFVGKVSLSMLLHRYGDILERVYVLVRKGSSKDAGTRFYDKVASSEPFEPLREKCGGEEASIAWLKSKVTILDGDITDPWVGLEETAAKALKGNIDVVINCAGLVSFNPSLEVGLSVNTHGVKYLVEACLFWDVPLVHMSTAFVAGNRSGLVFEDEPVVGYFPRRDELDGKDFSLEQELIDCEKQVARLRERADDKALGSEFRQRALDRLKEEGRDFTDEKAMRLAIGRERKLWLSGQLVQAGMDRAHHWGWPNTYTYTKSLGEQVIAATPNLRYAIVRPSIVESALRYPFPGWNEGFTTSAPIIYGLIKGQNALPAGNKAVLDMIPVDLVAGSLIAIVAQSLHTRERRVYQQASGDTNPFFAQRSVELTGLYKRRRFRSKETGNKTINSLRSRLEPQPVSKAAFELRSSPLYSKGAKFLTQFIDDNKPTWGAPKLTAMLEKAKEQLGEVGEQADGITGIVRLFLPFVWENRYVFRCDNTRSLYEGMPPEDRAKIPFDPDLLDWRDYILNIHMPGLEKWVFPGLDSETERRKVISAYRDLLEMFEASVHAWRHRVAFRMYDADAEIPDQRFTYGEAHHYAARIGSFLISKGVKPAGRVMLLSENRPEWPIAFFGVLRAGATAVPVDKELSKNEIINIARRSEAQVLLISEAVLAELPELEEALKAAKLTTQVFALAEALSGDSAMPNGIGPVKKSASPDDVASLIFTSGTTGTPKGVMLTHRNFTSLIAKLAGSFDIGLGDGVLSVLPLHHTFEFSAGLLTPFSRGAEIGYLDELSSDRIGDVMETGRITGMVGVPALWQLFHRKITQEFAARPKFIEEGIKALMGANAELRNRRGINLGKLLFWPVHRKFGGNIRFLISGGSALPDDVHKAFHALGFNLDEGYGLTEAAPVLAVTKAGHKRLPGTVGRSLPGVELKIHEPDGDGIGEVIAKGPNVMAGYFQDRDSTSAVLKDSWLFTGDLGRIDETGNLYLVGRKKDVIIDANGKNVYPDELEDLYGASPLVKELSVVGLPDDGGGEKVACLCVPDYCERPREDVRKEVEEHFRAVSAGLPFYRRIKVLRLWDGELPRTSTRKVKRPLVLDELKRFDKIAASAEKAKQQSLSNGDASGDWLAQIIADVVQKSISEVRPDSKLSGDLGLDSLMLTELGSALEIAGVPPSAVTDLTKVQTVDDLRRMVAAFGRRQHAEVVRGASKDSEEKGSNGTGLELPLPEFMAKAGRSMLNAGQRALYGGLFDVAVTGKSFIPQNRNVLVVSNHASHLDMGLIKIAMGEQGERLVALAARDYFFDTPWKRAYFENFTNLIPMDRTGSLRESLRLAGESLTQGYNLLIFPEGTRSPDGELQEFKPTTGYLALTSGVDVLPVYLKGTHAALPKGAWWPKIDDLEVRIGPALEIDQLRAITKGMSRSESYRVVTRLAEEAVRKLQDGKVLRPDALPVLPGGRFAKRVTGEGTKQ